MSDKSIWDEFTHQYKITKTLRFELIPQGKTAENIKANGIINASWANTKNVTSGEDATKAKDYKIAKQLFNEMHRIFIDEALSPENLKDSFGEVKKNGKIKMDFTELYKSWKQARLGDEKVFDKEHERLGKCLKNTFDNKANNWKKECENYYKEKKQGSMPKLKGNGVKLIYDNNTTPFEILEYFIEVGRITEIEYDDKKYLRIELEKVIRTFDKFHSYFSGFNENRANVYNTEYGKKGADGFTSSSIAYRLFEDNLNFFFENIEKWEKINKSVKNNENILKEKKWDYNSKIKQINLEIESFFKPSNFLNFLSQTGINSYNQVLGGLPAKEEVEKIQGINEIVNLTRQQAGAEKRDFPVMNLFYKSILSKSDESFIDAFNNEQELLETLNESKVDWENKKDRNDPSSKDKEARDLYEQIIHEFEAIFRELDANPNLKREYYLCKKSIEELSKNISGQYDFITRLWQEDIFDRKNEKGGSLSKTALDKLKRQRNFSFATIEKLITEAVKNDAACLREEWHQKEFSIKKYTLDKLNELIKTGKKYINAKNEKKKIKGIWEVSSDELNEILKNKDYGKSKDKAVEFIKDFLDAHNSLYYLVKSFQIKAKELQDSQPIETASGFLNIINNLLHEQFYIVHLYNKVRNFVTKKPYSTEKIKLNFGNAELASGWDVNKEPDRLTVLFKKDANFYLGIMKDNTIFNFKHEEIDKLSKPKEGEDFFEKIQYKLIKDVALSIPKSSTQLKKVQEHFASSETDYIVNSSNLDKMIKPLTISKNIFNLNNMVYDDSHKSFVMKNNDNEKRPKKFQKKYLEITGDNKGFKEAVTDWITFCKNFAASYESCLLFDYSSLKDSDEYDSLDQFYVDFNKIGYQISFHKVKSSYIDRLIEDNKLYFFQIYNKDFSPYSKGKENLHTSFWRMLFHPDNLKDVVAKLNGQAELFFRPASIKKENRIIHKSGDEIKNKNPLNPKKTSKFKIELIKDKRFTLDKYQFNCPITLNFKSGDNSFINNNINSFLADNPKVNIIGIDRGEKHLLYYTIINQNGKIIEQNSLNTMTSSYKNSDNKSVAVKTPYHKILDIKEQERQEARTSWKNIENIKELKTGYLSHVVHKLANLIIEHNAIVVLEDLNMGFKRGRFKVEKQVYQKFERALIQKLNYLVFKDKKFGESGHYLNAYQLTQKFESFEKLYSQSGILFYTTASYTSKTDPVTGFIQNYYKKYDRNKHDDFLDIFDSINFNGEYFEFSYDIAKIKSDEENPKKTKWTVGSCVTRSEYKPQTKKHELYNVNDKLQQLFSDAKIDYIKNEALLDEIKKLKGDNKFIKGLHYYFTSILKMRVVDDSYEKGTDENDYIQSPVFPFYSSNKIKDTSLPQNGDANGAYNIARKGNITIKKISLRERIKSLHKEHYPNEKFEKKYIGKYILNFESKNKVEEIFQDWLNFVSLKADVKNDFFERKGKKQTLTSLCENFVHFVSSLTVSKSDWQNYCQREDIVKLQIEKLKKE